MGKPMSKNLIKAGYSLVVYDICVEPVEELVQAGAEKAGSPGQVAQSAEVIITMLPDSPQVEEVILGKDGVLEGIKPGSVIIDMSSIAPSVSQKIAAQAETKGVDMLDAPVSGGETGAINAELAIMVGGREETFRQNEDILRAMGKSAVRIGDIGTGNIAKVANQIIVAINIEALGEAFILAKKAGVDPELLFQAIRGGLAGSKVMETKIQNVKDGQYKPGFKIRLHQKDIKNAMQTAKELNVPLPVTALVQQMIGSLVNNGRGDLDHSAIVTFIEDMT
jgi:2-hydroxy-3-oxopropionate reductase